MRPAEKPRPPAGGKITMHEEPAGRGLFLEKILGPFSKCEDLLLAGLSPRALLSVIRLFCWRVRGRPGPLDLSGCSSRATAGCR